jgi:hypothetical protein
VAVLVPLFVCDTCVSQFVISVKCTVAGSLIATGVCLASSVYVCMHPGKWPCG